MRNQTATFTPHEIFIWNHTGQSRQLCHHHNVNYVLRVGGGGGGGLLDLFKLDPENGSGLGGLAGNFGGFGGLGWIDLSLVNLLTTALVLPRFWKGGGSGGFDFPGGMECDRPSAGFSKPFLSLSMFRGRLLGGREEAFFFGGGGGRFFSGLATEQSKALRGLIPVYIGGGEFVGLNLSFGLDLIL